MARDPYQLCPCGSGKKLKFCCGEIADEMERIGKLQSGNQPKLALQQLDQLYETHPQNAWVITARAGMLVNDGQYEAARDAIKDFAETNTDHAYAWAIYASTSVATQGYDASRRIIHRAFQKASGPFPEYMSSVAMGIASIMYFRECHMACRQFLTLALRLSPEEDRQRIFVRLLEFESNQNIAYPLRSVHELANCDDLPDEDQKEAIRAARLCEIGCFGPAAKLFTRIFDKHPEQGFLALNIGLCRAWDGDHQAASKALHQAAELIADRAIAVECETIAQLFDLDETEEFVSYQQQHYELESVAKALTVIDDSSRLHRVPDQSNERSEEAAGETVEILDRDLDDNDRAEDWSIDDVPQAIGHVALRDADSDTDTRAVCLLTALEGDPFDTSREQLEQALGDLIKPIDAPDQADSQTIIPKDLMTLQWRWRLPNKTFGSKRASLEREKWRQAIFEKWLNEPMHVLGGQSPRDAAANPESSITAMAAIYVLDTFCDRNNYPLDLDKLLELLELEPLPPISLDQDLRLVGLSAMRLNLLPVEQLSDEQLSDTLNRALLLHHQQFLYRVLKEVVQRPACLEAVDAERVYRTLSELARSHNETDQAIQWLRTGYEAVPDGPQTFEQRLSWRIRELVVRLDNPQDPELPACIDELWNYYGTKLPQLRDEMAAILADYDLEPPSRVELAGSSPAEGGPGGLWTPESDAESSSGGQKLWVPGQDG